MTEEINSRNADKFVVRLKAGQRAALKARAKADNQTMNETAVTAIEKHLAQGKVMDTLLAILEREIDSGRGMVSIKRSHLWALLDSSRLPPSHEAVMAAGAAMQVPE